MNADQDRLRLRHMLDAAEKIVEFTQGVSAEEFLANEEKQLAIVRLLEIAGEAANSLSDDLKDRHAEIPWARSPLRAIGSSTAILTSISMSSGGSSARTSRP